MKALVRLVLLLALVASNVPLAQAATTPVPTCKLFASASTVTPNTKVRLDWTTTNATSGYLLNIGPIPAQGFTYVVPGKNTTYTASFTGTGGSVVCRVGIAVSSGNNQSTGVGGGSGDINTNQPIDTNHPIDINHPVDLSGSNPTLPIAPSVAQAPTTVGPGTGFLGGIVPAECRGDSTVANCDLCSLAQMGQNLANFLLGLSIPAAALLFAWAGILFFSSRGKESQITQARKVFTSVVIGFVIILSAWILVNTIMNTLVKGANFQGWNWKSLNCTQTRLLRQQQIDKKLSDLLSSSLPGLTNYVPPTKVTTNVVSCDDYLGGCFDNTQKAVDATTGAYVNNSSAGPGGTCKSGSTYGQDGSDIGTASCFDASGNVSDPIPNSNFIPLSNSYTSEQKILLSACSKGDMSSCESFSSTADSGVLGARIADTVAQYKGADTSMGPDGGNKACAWAVNNILMGSGIAPIDGDSVALMQQQLQYGGRGTLVGNNANLGNTSSGDIVVWKTDTMSHVGICQNNGCTQVASNSSANATFTTVTDAGFNKGVNAQIYRVTK